jgi:WD40 repeat protein
LTSNLDQVFSLSFDKIGKLLAISGRNGQTEVWPWNDPAVEPQKIESKGHSYSKISPDGKWLAQVTDEGYLNEDSIFNADSEKSLNLIDLEQQPKDPAILSQNTSIALAFSPDNHWLAYQDATDVILYDLQAGKGSLKLSAHKAPLISLTFSPDSRWLVSADLNSQAFLWDLSLPTPTPQKMGASAYPFYSLAFSPSGKYLGAGDTWGSLLIWNFASLVEGQLEPLRLFEQGCEGSYSSVDFNADESLLAQSCKQKVFFRNARKAYAIDSTFVFPFDRLVYQVKFSPDGNYLAVAGQGSTVYLYQVGRSLLRNSVCTLARRNLTNQEWLEFFPNETYQAICPQWPSAK